MLIVGLGLASGHVQAADISSDLKALAAEQYSLNRCIRHPHFRQEITAGSSLALESVELSSQIGLLTDQLQLGTKNKLLYLGYSNALHQLEMANQTELSIQTVCTSQRLGAMRYRLAKIEKNIRAYMARAHSGDLGKAP